MISGNKYNSLLETSTGLDMFNGVLTIVPPAPFSQDPSTVWTPRLLSSRQGAGGPVVLYDKRDQLLLRSIQIDSNLADGLVDALTGHGATGGSTLGLRMVIRYLRLYRVPGTITVAIGTPTLVTGNASSLFTQNVCVGQSLTWADNNGAIRRVTISAIVSDTVLTVTTIKTTGMNTGATTNGILFAEVVPPSAALDVVCPALNQPLEQVRFIGSYTTSLPISGTVSVAAGAALKVSIFTGKNTKFLSELVVGQFVRYAVSGTYTTIKVASIQSDTQFTATASTATAGIALAATDITIGWVEEYIAVVVDPINSSSIVFDTFSMNPAWAAGRIMFHAIATIEHTFPILETLSL